MSDLKQPSDNENSSNNDIVHPASEVQKLKPIILIIVIAAFMVILVMIIFNIFNTKKKSKPVTPPPNTVASSNTNKWFENAHVQKPVIPMPVVALVKNASEVVASSPVSNQMMPQGDQQISHLTQEEQQAAQDLRASMKAPLGSNELTPQSNNSQIGGGNAASHTGSGDLPKGQDTSGLPKDDQSMTAEKRAFVKNNTDISANVLSTSLNNPMSEYVLAFGSEIPAILDKEINSELPGQIYGHVSRDVYDSTTHSILLIPAGSNLVGSYDSAISYGQTRLLVAWKRINYPNGQWMDIQGMGGADPVGAGFGDQVDNHYWQILGATLITSVLAAGAQLSQPQQSNALEAPSTGQILGQSVGTQISSTGTQLVQKAINLQPTIHIRAGFEFTVEVNKDIIFPSPYLGNSNKN